MTSRKKNFFSLLLLIAIAFSIFFAVRFLHLFREYGPPRLPIRMQDPQLIRNWMTIEYISRAYHIPLDRLRSELQLKPGQEKIPIRALEREKQFQQNEFLVDQVKAVVSQEMETTQIIKEQAHELE